MKHNAYTLFWRDGKREVVRGQDPADAMNRRGYGQGALGALDFYANGDDNTYVWKGGKWERANGFGQLEQA